MRYNKFKKLIVTLLTVSVMVISVIGVNSISSVASHRGSKLDTIQNQNAYIGVDNYDVRSLSNGTHIVSVAGLTNNFKNRDIKNINVEVSKDPAGSPRILDIVYHPKSLSIDESGDIDVKIYCSGDGNTQSINLDIYASDLVSTKISVTEAAIIKCQKD